MNFAIIRNILGKIMTLLAFLMCLPLAICIWYKESLRNYLAFIIPMVLLFVIGRILYAKKAESNRILAREGFVIVGFSWIIMALFGSMPYMISGNIPNFFDAFFETASGFTTTGSSIVTDYSVLDHSIMFWRSFAHWIGGMGVLVFILAIIPESKEGSSMHILRAESPGPQVGKLVSKMRVTSRILYLIYLVLTIILILILWLGPDEKMNLFNSMVYSFGTAGTGGLCIDNGGLETYARSTQYIVATFMLIFAINFSMFYLILVGNLKEVFRNEELRSFLIIVFVSVSFITLNIYFTFRNLPQALSFEEAFRYAYFHVASIISTTGYSISDFIKWPAASIMILIFLTFTGACAGSTAGGLKLTRINILAKSMYIKIKNMISPRKVEVVKIDGKTMTAESVNAVESYIVVYMLVLLLCTFLISFDGFDFATNFTASLTCVSNVGPGYTEIVGPYGSFVGFSNFSKFVLSLEMITGRLEFFPILVLFSPKTWKKRV
jgi:trk system potassium uptake protein TrkH